MAHDTFQAGDLTAVIGDNAAAGAHRAGYNGVWSLTHRTEPTNLFVPAVAGLNLGEVGAQEFGDASTVLIRLPRNVGGAGGFAVGIDRAAHCGQYRKTRASPQALRHASAPGRGRRHPACARPGPWQG